MPMSKETEKKILTFRLDSNAKHSFSRSRFMTSVCCLCLSHVNIVDEQGYKAEEAQAVLNMGSFNHVW
jgi:hypothetical protein